MRLELAVKRKHIRAGVRGNDKSCAVALALKDRGFKNVTVSSTIYFKAKRQHFYLHTPLRVVRFIDKFDAGKNKVKPTTFVLDALPIL